MNQIGGDNGGQKQHGDNHRDDYFRTQRRDAKKFYYRQPDQKMAE